jgi:hypothetical protein
MRIMYDSVTAADIPANAVMVAGYLDGRYAWSKGDWQRFPAAVKVGIVINPNNNNGDVLDVEPGDATPGEAADWIRLRQRGGFPLPTLYYSKSLIGQIAQACQGLVYRSWVADWTGSPHSIPGAVAVQYASPETGSGGHYDLSAVYADDWPVASSPVPLDPIGAALLTLPTITTGSQDSHTVRKVQGLLTAQGPITIIDGSFGPITTAHVLEFQRAHNLAADGVVGPMTWAALVAA